MLPEAVDASEESQQPQALLESAWNALKPMKGLVTIIIVEGSGLRLLGIQRTLEMIHAQESLQVIEAVDARINEDRLQHMIERMDAARLECPIIPMRERRKAQWKQESNDRYIRRHK